MKEIIQIDLEKILRSRINSRKSRLIPTFLIRAVERLICQKELNEILHYTHPTEGTAFAERMYEYFELDLQVEGLGNIPDDRRLIFASNHPLGGLDGIGLIKILGAKYGDDKFKFLVNDMLMNVEPLRPVFLPINKYGSQGRAAATAIRQAYDSDKQILIFPAGLVSRLKPGGEISDLVWQKSFVLRAIESKRDIIPIHFEGLNRRRFYRIAKWRKKLGIKVNLEQVLLPSELCRSRGKKFKVIFGRPITWQSLADRLQAGESPLRIAAAIRTISYELEVRN